MLFSFVVSMEGTRKRSYVGGSAVLHGSPSINWNLNRTIEFSCDVFPLKELTPLSHMGIIPIFYHDLAIKYILVNSVRERERES